MCKGAVSWRRHVQADVVTQAWGQIRDISAPAALVLAQCQNQLLPFTKETVIDPTLGVRLPVQCCALYIDVLICWVKVHVTDRRNPASLRVRNIDRLEVWWNDEVDVLTRIREETDHGKGKE